MKYCLLLMCLYGSLQGMDRGAVNSETTSLLPISRYDQLNKSDRHWSGVTNIAKGLAADALGAGFFYAAQSGTGDNVMVPILYAGGVGFMLAGTIVVVNGWRKLCCGIAGLCRRNS